jgi:hypothetical protein
MPRLSSFSFCADRGAELRVDRGAVLDRYCLVFKHDLSGLTTNGNIRPVAYKGVQLFPILCHNGRSMSISDLSIAKRQADT